MVGDRDGMAISSCDGTASHKSQVKRHKPGEAISGTEDATSTATGWRTARSRQIKRNLSPLHSGLVLLPPLPSPLSFLPSLAIPWPLLLLTSSPTLLLFNCIIPCLSSKHPYVSSNPLHFSSRLLSFRFTLHCGSATLPVAVLPPPCCRLALPFPVSHREPEGVPTHVLRQR